eukprot:m51a1_g8204 putative serine-threonine protein (510) ;mRNA; r:44240-47628
MFGIGLYRQDLNESECGRAGLAWCASMQVCASHEEFNRSTTWNCKCDSVLLALYCWRWPGCEFCPATGKCRPLGACATQQSSARSGGSGRPWVVGVVVGACVGFALLAGVVVGVCVVAAMRSRPSAREAAMAVRGGFDASASREYAAGDASLGLSVSKAFLDFGLSSSPIEVDHEVADEFVVTNTSMQRALEEVAVRVRLEARCTTNLDVGIPLVNEGVGHTLVRIRVRTALTIKLDYNELQVSSLVGEGNYGRVYRGAWRGTEAAIKEYRAGMLEIEHIKSDVLREIDLLSRLRSPHVVTFYGVVLTRAHCCIVMEYCPLGSLAAMVARGADFSQRLCVKFALGCARGMQFLHANHVLHRDLKTDNLLVVSLDVASPSHVKLTDFGASRLVSDEGAASYTKGVGTCTYMAPEILNNMPYAVKADVYSFSLVVWSVLSRRAPFHDFPNQFAIIKFVVEGQRLPLPDGAPARAVELMQRCWDADPERRPAFDEIVAELEAIDQSLAQQGP